MIANLQSKKTDDWLRELGELESDGFPLTAVLSDSLFYPASGFDCDPVTYLVGYTTSFVYCDYGVSQEELDKRRLLGWFPGYHVIHQRTLAKEEIAPLGFRMPQMIETDPNPAKCAGDRKPEFFEWFVFERPREFQEVDRSRRFSLLYLGVDGVAAFNELYVARRTKPAAIAIIQPGHSAWGKNYTNFEDGNEILARLVLSNPAGVPDILMFGGNQHELHYSKACWPRFRRLIARPERSQPGHLGIWTRRKTA